MSIPIPLDRLRAALDERDGRAYVLTVSDDGRPHVVHGAIRWEGDTLAADVGGRSAANAAARPSVSLLCPVRSDGDYSLIVDGHAAVVCTKTGNAYWLRRRRRSFIGPRGRPIRRPRAARTAFRFFRRRVAAGPIPRPERVRG
jgi:pyridoxine/pyridoxamine 5'-phosphate oxidase